MTEHVSAFRSNPNTDTDLSDDASWKDHALAMFGDYFTEPDSKILFLQQLNGFPALILSRGDFPRKRLQKTIADRTGDILSVNGTRATYANTVWRQDQTSQKGPLLETDNQNTPVFVERPEKLSDKLVETLREMLEIGQHSVIGDNKSLTYITPSRITMCVTEPDEFSEITIPDYFGSEFPIRIHPTETTFTKSPDTSPTVKQTRGFISEIHNADTPEVPPTVESEIQDVTQDWMRLFDNHTITEPAFRNTLRNLSIALAAARPDSPSDVTETTVSDAVSLLEETSWINTEIAPGEFDLEFVETGDSQTRKPYLHKVLRSSIEDLCEDSESFAVPEREIIEEAVDRGISKERAEKEFTSFKQKGYVFEVNEGEYALS